MQFYIISKFYGLTILLLNALALVDAIGWGLGIKPLTNFIPALPAMSIFTACSFVLCALGLFSLRHITQSTGYRIAVVILSVAIACLSLTSFSLYFDIYATYLTNIIRPYPALLFFSSPTTSFTLLLSAISIGILATPLKIRHTISQVCALIMMALMILIFISYLSEAINIYQFKDNIGIALPTAIGLLLLSGALFFAFPQQALAKYFLHQSTAAAAQRQLLPVAILLPILTFIFAHLIQNSHVITNEATNSAISSFITILALVGFTFFLRKYISHTENQFDIMANSAPVMMWMADTKGQTVFFNDQWLAFTGRNLDDEKSTDFDQCVHPDDKLRSYHLYEQAYAQHKSFAMEYRLKHHNGEYRQILEKVAPYQGIKGQFKGFIGSCVDISQNKKLQTILEEKNQTLNKEIALRKRIQQEQNQRNELLEYITTGQSLNTILNKIITTIEQSYPTMLGSILLFDEQNQSLHLCVAPSLPDFYNQAIDGVKIGPNVGSCGTAAYTKKSVIVEDISTHPYWKPFKDLAAKAGLSACWSTPVLSSKGNLLATFAIYYQKPYKATETELRYIDKMKRLVTIAIERKLYEDELRIAAHAFQSHDAIFISDAHNNILRTNSAFTKITGYSADEVLGKNPRILSSGQQDQDFYQTMHSDIASKGKWEGEIWNRRKDGSVFPEWLTVTAVKSESGETSHHVGIVTHYVAIFSDITDKKNAEKEIHDLAFYDPLTHLANRRLLLERLKQEVVVARRYQRFGAIIFFDLDKFKNLNDTLGHQAGDELLIKVAQRLLLVVREEDTACRLGGDEFVVLLASHELTEQKAKDHALILAEKIRHSVSQPFNLKAGDYTLSASLGVTTYSATSENLDDILQQADSAMYQSKDSGRNTVNIYQ